MAAVLGRNGVRHGVTFAWSYSNADAVRAELEHEAVKLAVAKARALGELAGARVGGVLDLGLGTFVNVQSGNTIQIRGQGGLDNLTFQPSGLSVPQTDVEDGMLLLHMTASVTLQSKPE